MQIKNYLIGFLLLTGIRLNAQKDEDIRNYISAYKEVAISEMIRTGVPASITLAQGIHETSAGMSDLVLKSNNHFGIKCKSVWTGDKVYHDDDARGECFRSYGSPLDSYKDHSDFLKTGTRYAFLFEMDPTDYKAWAMGLKKAGYATNIKYPQILIRLIEEYDLQQYTLIAMNNPTTDEILAANRLDTQKISIGSITTPVVEQDQSSLKPEPGYPEGVFQINNTKVVFARGGSSLFAIAQQYSVPLGRLLEFNDLKEDGTLDKDQLVYLQRKRKTGAAEFHVIRKGESLYDVCQEQAIRIESLLEYNHLQSYNVPAIGEKLYLKSTAPAKPKLADDRL